jgi:hypothetical protein
MAERADDAEVKDLESTLRGLRPRADLDREALMYRAGRAAAGRGWGWPLTTAAALALAATLAVRLWTLPPPAGERIVFVPAPPASVAPQEHGAPPLLTQEPTPAAPAASADAPDALPYASPHPLRDHVLRWGLDGLPPAPELSPTPPTDTPASLLRTQ